MKMMPTLDKCDIFVKKYIRTINGLTRTTSGPQIHHLILRGLHCIGLKDFV